MKILVGVTHRIENEFEECLESLNRQSYRNFEVMVIENLPLKEASYRLYKTFMDRAEEFQLLIKVDADMVIENKELFSKVVDKFSQDRELEKLEIAVQNFFSDQLIWSMNVYRNTVRWIQSSEDLFVDDDAFVSPLHVQHDDRTLAPAALHCKNPSSFQSFHFGVYNMLKVIQPHLAEKRRYYADYYWNVAEKTYQNLLFSKDRRIGFAVLGGELAIEEDFLPEHISYSNPYLSEVFKSYEDYNDQQLWSEIAKLRNKHWGILPSHLRKKWVCSLRQGAV